MVTGLSSRKAYVGLEMVNDMFYNYFYLIETFIHHPGGCWGVCESPYGLLGIPTFLGERVLFRSSVWHILCQGGCLWDRVNLLARIVPRVIKLDTRGVGNGVKRIY